MAMEPDIRLLIGAAMGGAGGDSYALIRKQLQKASKDSPIEIEINIDKEKMKESVKNALSKISESGRFKVEISSIDIGSSAVNEFKTKLSAIMKTMTLEDGRTVTISTDGLGDVSNEGKKAKKDLEDATTAAKKFRGELKAIDAVNKAFKSKVTSAQKMNADGTINAEKFNELRVAYEGIENATEALQNKLAGGPVDDAEIEKDIAKIKELQAAFAALFAEVSKKNSKDVPLSKVNSLLGRVDSLLANNTNASALDEYKELAALRDELAKLATGAVDAEGKLKDIDKVRLDQIKAKADALEAKIKELGLSGKTMGDLIANAIKKFGSWTLVTRTVTAAIRLIKNAIKSVREIQSSMAQLKIVTGATDSQMKSFLSNASQLAKNLGKSITGILSSIETFSRLGYNLADASKLAEFATIMSNVAGVEVGEATTGMTSIIKGYNMDVDNAEHVADVLVQVGQKYAVSAAELMDAFEKSGAALNASNTSFEKSAALIAAANASVQNSSTVGTALKTVSARIRGAKSDLEELGEDVNEFANGFSKYASEIKALTGFSITVEGRPDTYKDIYEIFDGISKVWDRLSDTQQSRVSEILGGTRQLQVISSIIGNWDDAVNAYADAMSSAGTATQANAIYMGTLDAKLSQLSATWQSLSSKLFDAGPLGVLVDILRIILELLDELFSSEWRGFDVGGLLSGLVMIAGGVSAAGTAANVAASMFTTFAKTVAKAGTAGAATSTMLTVLSGALEAISGAVAPIILVTAALFAIYKVVDHFHVSAEEAKQKAQELQDGYRDTTEELSEVNDELELANKRIKELTKLSSARTLTLVEQEELDNLEKEVEYLERRKKILDEQKKDKAREADDAHMEAFEKQEYNSVAREFYEAERDAVQESYDAAMADGRIEEAQHLLDRLTALQNAIDYGYDAAAGVRLDEKLSPEDYYKHLIEYYKILDAMDVSSMSNSQLDAYKSIRQKLVDYAGELNTVWIDGFILDREDKQKLQDQSDEIYDILYHAQTAENKAGGIDPSFKKYLLDAANAYVEDGGYSDVIESNNDGLLEQIRLIRDLADEYNELTNGNVDYNKRPLVTPDEMRLVYPDFDGDVGTTYSSTYTIGDGEALYTIEVTPILEDGTVLSQQALEDYISGLITTDGENGVLGSDTENLIINIASGDYDEEYWNNFREKIGEVKNKHWELIEQLQEDYGLSWSDIQDMFGGIEDAAKTAGIGLDAFSDSSAYMEAVINSLYENDGDFKSWLDEAGVSAEELAQYFLALATAADEAEGSTTDLKDAASDFTTASEKLTKLQKALDGISGDTLDIESYTEIIGLIPEYAGEIYDAASAQEALRKAINDTKQEAVIAYGSMAITNSNYVSQVLMSNSSLVSALSRYYGDDAANWRALASGKLKVDVALVQRLSELWAKYIGTTTEELKSMYNLYSSAASAAEMSGNFDAADSYFKLAKEVEAVYELREATEKAFEDAVKGVGAGGSSDKYVADIEKYREAIERLNRVIREKEDLESRLSNTDDAQEQIDLNTELIEVYKRQQEAQAYLNRLRRETITEGVASLQGLGFDVEWNADKNEFFVRNLEHLNELSQSSIKETEEFINKLEELNDQNQEGSETWRDLAYSIKDAKQNIIDALDEIVSKANEVVDGFQNVYSTLTDAAKEYAQTGLLSVDSLQSILDLGPQYLAYLVDEGGQLKINEESLQNTIAAKTDAMAADTAYSYAKQILIATQDGEIETLRKLADASIEESGATWDLAYSTLGYAKALGSIKGIDVGIYDTALSNIQKMQSLTKTATKSISAYYKSQLDPDYVSWEDGLNSILDITKEMIKWETENQKAALEQQKKDLSDIISLRKEALDAAKKEADYDDDVEDKIREIAKLQARINALSLDDSRDAQAQKIKLEEEMYELQKELSKLQADHAVESKKDALDKMQKAYEDQKDDEISALEDKLSSEEKLYQEAINRISNDWDSIYDQLLEWNYEYGSTLQKDLENAWGAAKAAAQEYGSFVAAMDGVKGYTNLGEHSATGAGSGGGSNNTSYTDSAMRAEVSAKVKEMYNNSLAYGSASKEEKDRLAKRNDELGAKVGDLLNMNVWRDDNGVWWANNERLYDNYMEYTYHTGGIAGNNPTLKQNEVMALLEKGEPVLDKRRELAVYKLVDFATIVKEKIGHAVDGSALFNSIMGNSNIVNKVKPSIPNRDYGNQNPSIHFGDVYIYGANNETVEKHREVNRQFANDILKQLNIKR